MAGGSCEHEPSSSSPRNISNNSFSKMHPPRHGHINRTWLKLENNKGTR